MNKILCPLLLVFCGQVLLGQTVLDTNPTSLRWQKVKSEHFRVLFPLGFETEAQRVANTLEHIRVPEAASLGSVPRKFTIVLQNQSTVSNGFVSILPRRSEFFTMAPQDYNFLGTNDWLDLLATHEYRHIVQYQHATRGFNRVAYYLFGSTTLAALAQVAVPQWFWEGDAVATETAFTHSGRGRIPNFGLVFKTNLMEGRSFNYHKQYLRSYKNFIPNHYVLGYYMVSYLRKKTNDPDIWGKITARAWNVPIVPFAFSNAIHNKTGLHVTSLYREMAASLTSKWQDQTKQLTITPFEIVSKRKSKSYTDYLYPQSVVGGGVIAMKRGIGDIEQFVLLKNGEEEKQFTPGFINDAGMLSVSGSKIVWSEYGFDPRWSVRNYSQLKVFDVDTGMKWVVGGRRSRLSGAALSPDAKMVVAIQSNKDYQNTIQILDVFTGNVVKEFPNPDNNFYSMPRWTPDGQRIVLLKTSREGRTITVIDHESGRFTDILPVTLENVGYPVPWANYIFFSSPVTGIDNIFAINLKTNGRFKITSSKYAAYNPNVSADEKTLYYNDQSRDGLDVVAIPLDTSSWQPFEVGEMSTPGFYEHLVEQEGRSTLLDSIPQQKYPTSKYFKAGGIINPYNWGGYVNNDLTQLSIGITSRDILSTTLITAGYTYDINEQTSLWRAGASYQAIYPIIDVDAQAGSRENTESGFGNDIKFTWDEIGIEGGIRLPFVLTNSKYSRRISLINAAGFTKTSSFNNRVTQDGTLVYEGPDRIVPLNDTLIFIYNDQLNDGNLLYNRASLSFSNLLKRSLRDFHSRWGQTVDVEFYNTPYGGDFEGQLLAARMTLYFPGAFKHHFLYGRAGYQQSLQRAQTNLYTFRNRIPKPRGHSYPADETFFSASANYALPLWYPDIALGPIVNVQRVKANIFYDYGQGEGRQFFYNLDTNRSYASTNDEVYQSVGIETTFDFNIFRFLPKFELGLRSTYRFSNAYNSGGMVFEFLIGNIGF